MSSRRFTPATSRGRVFICPTPDEPGCFTWNIAVPPPRRAGLRGPCRAAARVPDGRETSGEHMCPRRGRGGVRRPQWVADRLSAIGTRASELPRGRPLRSPPPSLPSPLFAASYECGRVSESPRTLPGLPAPGGWALRPWTSHLLGRQAPHTSREAEAVPASPGRARFRRVAPRPVDPVGLPPGCFT